MPYTDLQIINNALRKAKCAKITTIGENSECGRVAADLYPMERDGLLAKIDWNFARIEYTVSETTNPSQMYAYCYAYPADCLKVRYFVNPLFLQNQEAASGLLFSSYYPITDPDILTPAIQDINYQVRPQSDKNSKVILTNLQMGIIIYTAQITNPSVFDDTFREAFELKLAAEFAGAINKNTQDKMELMQEFKIALAEAEYASGKEETEDAFVNNPLLDSRN